MEPTSRPGAILLKSPPPQILNIVIYLRKVVPDCCVRRERRTFSWGQEVSVRRAFDYNFKNPQSRLKEKLVWGMVPKLFILFITNSELNQRFGQKYEELIMNNHMWTETQE